MNTLTINASEFSRGLSEFLNQVQYTGQIFEIERGKRVIARVSPVREFSVGEGFPISKLSTLFGQGKLEPEDADRMVNDINALRASLANRVDPWGS